MSPEPSSPAETIARLNEALADRYRIERKLGEGGMATVWLAHDLRHDRRVALKVLRPELAAILGAERFLQEIKTTANLQHPHILPLHDSGEAAGSVFYVMPYVEGESLRDRLQREKQLPIADAVRITREVASALDYAHRHGVVHRDIKPENILLHDGQALVADFGIALAASRSDGGTRMTETGMSLGTPQYMSPEQAMGEREITPRSDVYALGCVAYEMLSGDPPFTGSTAQAVVARVVTEQPRPLTSQRHTVPPHIEAAVLTALEKLPADRFASAAEFAEALVNEGSATRRLAPSAPTQDRARGGERRVVLLLGLIALAATALAAWGWLRPRPEPPVIRYSLGLPAGQEMLRGIIGVNLAISRDGRRLVYLGPGERGGMLWLRDRSQLHATLLAGTEAAYRPVFSPDGRRIAFSVGTENTLKVVAVEGGPAVTLAVGGGGSGGGLAWSDDGWIYFDCGGGGYCRIRATGGEPENILPLDSLSGEEGLAWPEVLPGNKRIVFRSRRGMDPTEFDLVVVDLASGKRHLLTRGLVGRYVAPGYLVFARADGALMAAPFGPGDTALRGPATPILEGLMTKAFGSVDLAISREGTLVYVPGQASSGVAEVVRVSREGGLTRLNPPLAISSSAFRGLALSPDGTRLALDISGPQSVDIWVKQLPSGPVSRLTFDGEENVRPSWTADGRDVVFISDRGGIPGVWRQRADGSAPAQLLLQRSRPVYAAQLSRDGRWLLYRENADSSLDIHALRVGQDTAPIPLLTSRFNENSPALSPDGAWLAYVSDESGTPEVYVRPFPRITDGRWQVSRAGGRTPRWSRGGRELFFESAGNEMMVASVKTQPTFTADEPRALFRYSSVLVPSGVVPNFDLTPDDKSFIMARFAGAESEAGGGQLIVVENWFQELRAKVKQGQE